MQIVIDIPDEWEKRIKNNQRPNSMESVDLVMGIWRGKILPKGHGNLIQREDAEAIFKNARKALYEQSRKERIKDFQTREMMLLNAEQFIHLIHPIIEADKESEDKE